MSEKYIGKDFLGKYKIIKLIGTGGMESKVYKAENMDFGINSHFTEKFKYVAIKFISKTNETSSDNWSRILDEGVTNARLAESDNIVKLFEIHRLEKDQIALVMEYMNGKSLKTFIRDRGCLSITETLSIFKKILLGVADMHTKDRVIIHRDLKPENIMLSDDIVDVKIADFGISSVIVNDGAGDLEVLTNENSFFGTIPYVTPDAINNKNTKGNFITKQYDFHALGIILYEMLIGEKPFELEDENDVSTILYWNQFDIVPMKFINCDIRNEIENVFLKLTASKPNMIKHRYNNVFEILDDISEIEKRISNKLDELPTLLPYDKRVYQNKFTFDIYPKEKRNIIYNFKTNLSLYLNIGLIIVFTTLVALFLGLGAFVW